MNRKRRILLKTFVVGGTSAVALGSGLVSPQQAWAMWPEKAFDADNLDAALQELFAGASAEQSDAISLKAPDIAENGAVVPITVKAELEQVESISILVEKNPAPLAASFELSATTIPEVSTRLKMGTTSNVIAVVKSDGKLFINQREVKVTIGGCGG